MKNIITSLIFLVCLSGYSIVKAGDEPKLKTYYLVLLKKGPHRDQDSLTARKIMEGHMAHLNKMATDKKMCIAGPVAADMELRGICVYTTDTKEEAQKLANSDPAVVAGRLIAEVIPWMSESGNCLP